MTQDELVTELWDYAREVPMGEHPWFQESQDRVRLE